MKFSRPTWLPNESKAFADADYLSKLSPEQRQWIELFYAEYYRSSSSQELGFPTVAENYQTQEVRRRDAMSGNSDLDRLNCEIFRRLAVNLLERTANKDTRTKLASRLKKMESRGFVLRTLKDLVTEIQAASSTSEEQFEVIKLKVTKEVSERWFNQPYPRQPQEASTDSPEDALIEAIDAKDQVLSSSKIILLSKYKTKK